MHKQTTVTLQNKVLQKISFQMLRLQLIQLKALKPCIWFKIYVDSLAYRPEFLSNVSENFFQLNQA